MEHRPRPRLPPSRVLIAEGERAPTRRSFLVEVRTVGHSGILENLADEPGGTLPGAWIGRVTFSSTRNVPEADLPRLVRTKPGSTPRCRGGLAAS